MHRRILHDHRGKQRPELGSRRDEVRGGEFHDVTRHARKERIGRVLRHHQAAALMHGKGAGGAVVEHSGQHDTDDPRAECPGCRAEKGVDGGPVAALVRAAGEQHLVVGADEVPIGPGDENRARRQLFAGHRDPGGSRPARARMSGSTEVPNAGM